MLMSSNAEDLPRCYAPASERAGQKPLLVVVGGVEDEVETCEGIQTGTPSAWQFSPTNESSTIFDSH